MRITRTLITAVAACWLPVAAFAQQQTTGGMGGMGGMSGMGGMGGMSGMSMGQHGMHMNMPGVPQMHMGPGGGPACMMMQPGQMGMGGMGGMGMGGMAGMGGMMMPVPVEQRLMHIQAQLGITEAQAAKWNGYANAMPAHAQAHMAHHAEMMKGMAATPPERLDAHIKGMEAMALSLKAVKPALDELYGALNEQQKQLANMLLGPGCMM